MNTNDIVTRLQNGESMETIATEITNMLNEAQLEYDKQCAAKNTHKAVVRSAAELLVDALLDYLNVVVPGCIDKVTDEEVAELVEDVIALGEGLPHAMELLQLACKVPTPTDNKKDIDDIISTFLKNNFLS